MAEGVDGDAGREVEVGAVFDVVENGSGAFDHYGRGPDVCGYQVGRGGGRETGGLGVGWGIRCGEVRIPGDCILKMGREVGAGDGSC